MLLQLDLVFTTRLMIAVIEDVVRTSEGNALLLVSRRGEEPLALARA